MPSTLKVGDSVIAAVSAVGKELAKPACYRRDDSAAGI